MTWAKEKAWSRKSRSGSSEMMFEAGKFSPLFFLFLLPLPCLTSDAFAETNFYTLAQRWEKSNAYTNTSKKIPEPGVRPLRGQNDFSDAAAFPVPLALTRRLEELTGAQRVIDLEQKQSLFVKTGQPVLKFVSTEEDKVLFESLDPQTLRIEGTGVGLTFVHIWTSDGTRSTFQVRVFPQKFIPSVAQLIQQEALNKSRSFKIGYNASRDAFYTGERYREISRGSLSFTQSATLEGDTPYGAFSSHAQTQRSGGKTLLTDAQVALKDGQIGSFRNFNAAAGDSRVTPGLMVFPGARIRGVDVDHWDETRRFDWDAFYGREQTSIVGTLTPGISSKNTLNSYLRGGVVNYKFSDDAKIKGGYFVGSGRSRSDDSPKRGEGLRGDMNFGPHVSLTPEADFDDRHVAQRESVKVSFDKFRLRGEYRNIGKNFETLIGAPGSQGELGYLLEGNATVLNNAFVTASTDIFRDRLVPNPLDLQAYNVHTDLSLGFTPWESSSATLTYQETDDTGRLSPNRQKSYGAMFNQRVHFLGHRGTIFTRYQNRENTILNNDLSDYRVDQVTAGYVTQLFWDINFSISEQVNFLNEFNLSASSMPRALECNFDRSSQLSNTPIFTELRLRIRDEEDTESVNSFMSGYDTAELSGSLNYRGFENMEIFLTGSFQNYKPESLNVTAPRVELQFLTGVRYLFDTQFRWSAVGSFDGTVFKDLNGDGVHQPEEPGIEGITVKTADNKEAVTNAQGFYDLKSISGKNVTLILDTSKLPYGYVPTTSARQDLPIVQSAKRHVDFGVTPRSEVTGIIFNDLDGDGKYQIGVDQGVGKVKIKLETGSVARSNNLGVYSFSDVIAGPHTASIDFSNLPEGFLPEGIPQQTFTLYEGIRYELNFPLRAVRSITGRVYFDSNKNKKLGGGEKVFGNVKVRFAGESVLTDKDGWYLFDGLSNGSYELSMEESTLSAGYFKPDGVKIDLPVNPITITDLDISLKEKS